MFDQWDHTLQTGNDTEYTFVAFVCWRCLFAEVAYTSNHFAGFSDGSDYLWAHTSVIFGNDQLGFGCFDPCKSPSCRASRLELPKLPIRWR